MFYLHEAFNHESVSELYSSFKNFKPNGKAFLIEDKTNIQLSRDLMEQANLLIRNNIRNMRVRKMDADPTPNTLDEVSREFLIQYTLFNESLINSYSFTNENFEGLKSFDKVQLKEKLERLINIL